MGYTPSFTPQYENGWEDLPSETSPITAEALNSYDDAIENIENYLASDEMATIEKAVHYSTDEEVIGTFLDETLYRKVYTFNEDVAISMTSWTNVNSYIPNIGFSTFVRCYGVDANGTYQGEILCGLDANNQLQMLSPSRNGTASISVTKIIIEYTKTS